MKTLLALICAILSIPLFLGFVGLLYYLAISYTIQYLIIVGGIVLICILYFLTLEFEDWIEDFYD